VGLTNEEWRVIRAALKSWSAPGWDADNDAGYRMVLNDMDPKRVGQALSFIGQRDAGRFRPSAHEIKAAYDQLHDQGPPKWTRAERMAAKAVTRRTKKQGEELLHSQEGGEYVLAWLWEYGWQRFATEPQDSYTYNAQRKSYEEHITTELETKATKEALGTSKDRPRVGGSPRQLRPAHSAPGSNAMLSEGQPWSDNDRHSLDF
jgi:hypothetical protein